MKTTIEIMQIYDSVIKNTLRPQEYFEDCLNLKNKRWWSEEELKEMFDELNFAVEGCKDARLRDWYKNYLKKRYKLK